MKARLVKLKNFIVDNIYIIAAMLAVDFIMAFVFYTYDLWPFGDITILRMDLYHQYWPLFTELYDRLTEHKSLIYSWNTGLGGPFLGNFYNYLSSPFLVYILLAGRNHIAEAISMMIVSKASLAAGTFTYYLKKSQGSNSFITAAFGVLYAQSAWFVAFYWNVMWLDALYLLPLVVLGIERLIKDKKPLLYIFSLAFTLLTNYYMGYMVCIFSVIWFLAYYFSNYRLISDTGEHISTLGEKRTLFEKLRGSLFINRGFTFAFSSFLAAGLVAFALLPTFIILKSSSATSGTFPGEIKSYFNFLDFLSNHLAGWNPVWRSSADVVPPNMYCGVLALILTPLYIFSKKISFREKLIAVLTLAFLYLSFKLNILNYIWHGFHIVNDLPHRFSFIYVFLVLVIGIKTIRKINYQGAVTIALSVIIAVIGIVAVKVTSSFSEINSIVISSVLFLALYLIVFVLYRFKKTEKSLSCLLVFCVVIMEMVFCNTSGYQDGLNVKKINAEITECNEFVEAIYNSKDVNRIEFNSDLSKDLSIESKTIRMKPALYGYNGVSVFSSMASEKMTDIQKKLGLQNNGINSYTYALQTPVYNAMNSIEYVITEKKTTVDKDYYKLENSTKNLNLLKNKYYLSLAFIANSDVADWQTDESNPFLTQINWFKLASGESGVFEEISTTCKNDIALIEAKDGKFVFEKSKIGNELTFAIDTKEKQHIFIYAYSKNYTCCVADEKVIAFDNLRINDYGVLNSGEKIEVKFSSMSMKGDGDTVEIYLKCYAVNDEVFNKGYEKLKQSPLEITSFNETNIKGTVNAKEDGTMWTSIPYDKGWSVTADGKAIETIAVQDAYLCFDMPAGEHTVELTYTQPGLKEGVCISIVSLLLCTAYVVILKKKQK